MFSYVDMYVPVNTTVTLDITMSAAVSETITVTSAAPVIDVTSSGLMLRELAHVIR